MYGVTISSLALRQVFLAPANFYLSPQHILIEENQKKTKKEQENKKSQTQKNYRKELKPSKIIRSQLLSVTPTHPHPPKNAKKNMTQKKEKDGF